MYVAALAVVCAAQQTKAGKAGRISVMPVFQTARAAAAEQNGKFALVVNAKICTIPIVPADSGSKATAVGVAMITTQVLADVLIGIVSASIAVIMRRVLCTHHRVKIQ
jgi:hypothetical protein